MKKPFPIATNMGNFFTQDMVIKRFVFATVAINIASFLAVILSFGSLPPKVPLFYSRPWGQDQLTPTYLLLLPIISSFIFLFVNILLSTLMREQTILTRALTCFALFSTLLGTITIIRILALI